MFGKLKEKLKNWAKSIKGKDESEEIEEIDVTEPKKEKKSKKKEKLNEQKEPKEKKKNKKESKEEQIIPEPEIEKTETITEIIEEDEEPEKAITKEPKTEIIKDESEIEEEKQERRSFFTKFASKLSKVEISEKDFWTYAEELETLLLENNVAFEVSDKIIMELKDQIVGKDFLKKEVEFQITETLKDIIYKVLIEPFDIIEKIKLYRGGNPTKPYVILFCGINGTGKTTSIAKIAKLLEKNKLSCVFAAGDTFRAASIEQLKKHGENLNVNVIAHEYGSDPAAVGFDAIKYAEKNDIDVVLVDTAGRMHTEKNLMAQIEKVAKVTNPHCKIFVGESITGNDIVEQIKAFNESVKIDGIILSKADIDDKGGTALSVGYTTGKPILFLGTGQNYADLEKFDKNKFIEKLGLS